MKNYKKYFKGKKITIMGLGLLGRGVGDAIFLAECGAELIVTDLKTRGKLKSSLEKLKKYEKPAKGLAGIKYTLGKHKIEDFQDRDMIIKAAGVPLSSPYIKEAEKNQIPVEMDASLFLKLAPEIISIGITGTRGKSMTTTLIYEILSQNIKGKKVHLGGNLRGMATLPLLSKIKKGDIFVAELDSWQLQGFGSAEISPNIAVFTSFMQDHMNYYKDSMAAYLKDKMNIFKFQEKGDLLVIRSDVQRYIPQDLKSKLVVARLTDVEKYDFIVPGDHQRENLACAVAVARHLGVHIKDIKKTAAEFQGLEGRLQFIGSKKGVSIYNDNNATTPAATVAGILSLSKVSYQNPPKLILIVGGSDKKLSLHQLVKVINKNCKAIVTIPGEGTDRLLGHKIVSKKVNTEKNIKNAVMKAMEIAEDGDTILFSPAFSSFSQFDNEYERNDSFMEVVNSL